MKTIIKNGQVLNVHTSRYEKKNIVVECDRIIALTDAPVTAGERDTVIDAEGTYIIPGLIDAHVHVTSATVDLATPQLPITYITCCAIKNLSEALQRGFTTMRDVGGADFGLAMAVNSGVIPGSRLFYCGRALSQTGGHGDFRAMTYDGEYGASMQSSATSIGQIADGITEVRRACRSELRKGASFIKIMAAGGVASPGDRVTDTQYSNEELSAIAGEAEAKSTYVAAHVYSAKAIQICLKHGVRTIEHGNLLDEETAAMMKESGAYLIPTVITYDALARRGAEYQFPEVSINKIASVRVQALEAVKIARRHGVKIGFGTDLLGPLWEEQSNEFALRSRVEKPIDTIISATKINAEVLNQSGNLGEISEKASADILILAKNPAEDISAITDRSNIRLIMKAGTIYKNTL
ncbi:amidohydrolase family protein [uncultured Methanoregula sp.]|uniref:metal-dependent hydrolase family protein n=1 Tax=uncultured Methanoregula sp. TaxID=1005933 RepID=UPI002AAA6F93|nr:amidohydrolase family protein [uncultured Methanoregula sp.]